MSWETRSFTVEDIAYEVAFTGRNEFFFYVLPRQSRRVTYDEDELAWNFYDEVPERTSYRSEFVTTTRPLAVYRNVLSIVGHMLRRRRPYYFTFCANEPDKMDLYTLVAHRLARTYGYFLEIESNAFRFYRQPEEYGIGTGGEDDTQPRHYLTSSELR